MNNHIILNIIFLFSFLTLALLAQNMHLSGDENWPGFRGDFASGIAENASPPTSWNLEKSENITWKTEVPGLGFSSPVIWGDRLFLTTAISGLDDPELKVGLYGSIDPVEDETVHTWKVLCYNKNTGESDLGTNILYRNSQSETTSKIHPC